MMRTLPPLSLGTGRFNISAVRMSATSPKMVISSGTLMNRNEALLVCVGRTLQSATAGRTPTETALKRRFLDGGGRHDQSDRNGPRKLPIPGCLCDLGGACRFG